MSWVVALTGPGPDQNHVDLDVLARGLPLATVNGSYEWETRPEANAAQSTLRARIKADDERAASQRDLFGGSHD